MVPRRLLPLATIAIAAFALTGCVLSPPPLAPQAPTTTEPTTAPSTPATSAPETSESSEPSSPAPSSTGAPASTGSTVTIDGQPVGSWGGTLTCLTFGESALVTSDSEDETGTLVGSLENVGGAWQATGFLLTNGDDVYFQSEETVPASIDGGTLTVELAITDFSGAASTLAVTSACS